MIAWAVGCSLALALSSVHGGCRPPVVVSPDVRALPSPGEVFRALGDKAATRRSMRALGRVTYFGEGKRLRLRTVLLAEREGRFRVEVLSPAEEPVGIMTCNGERLWLLKDRRLREGPATPENIARLLPIAMFSHEIVDVLLGGVTSSGRFEPVKLVWADETHTGWALTLQGTDGDEVHLVVDPTRQAVLSARFLRDGAVRMTVEFDDFKGVEGDSGEFPRTIITQMRGEQDVRIKLEELELNVALSPALFELSGPSGVRPEPMDSPPAMGAPPG